MQAGQTSLTSSFDRPLTGPSPQRPNIHAAREASEMRPARARAQPSDPYSGGPMKKIQALALLGAVLSAACSELHSVTAPKADAAASATASVTADRPYTWNVNMFWRQPLWCQLVMDRGGSHDRDPVDTTCYPASSPIAGNGTRPAAADGFSASVNGTCRTWTFDPASAFSAQLKGSASLVLTYPVCWGHGHNGVCKDKLAWSATLKINS